MRANMYRFMIGGLIVVSLLWSSLEAKPGSFSRPSSGGFSRPSSGGFKSSPSPSRPSSGSFSRPSSSPPKSSGSWSKPSSGWGSSSSSAAKQSQSRQTFKQSQSPKESYVKSYKDPTSGKEITKPIKIQPDRSSVKQLRSNNYTHDKYSSRPQRRETVVYHNYYGRSYPPTWNSFSDGISPFFWLWLMESNSNNQAQYIHNHRDSIDEKRLEELYAKNAALRVEVEKLKDKPRDPNYVPEGMKKDDADLMYDDDYVAAAANFEQEEVEDEGWGFWPWFWIVFGVLVVGIIVFVVVVSVLEY